MVALRCNHFNFFYSLRNPHLCSLDNLRGPRRPQHEIIPFATGGKGKPEKVFLTKNDYDGYFFWEKKTRLGRKKNTFGGRKMTYFGIKNMILN